MKIRKAGLLFLLMAFFLTACEAKKQKDASNQEIYKQLEGVWIMSQWNEAGEIYNSAQEGYYSKIYFSWDKNTFVGCEYEYMDLSEETDNMEVVLDGNPPKEFPNTGSFTGSMEGVAHAVIDGIAQDIEVRFFFTLEESDTLLVWAEYKNAEGSYEASNMIFYYEKE